MPRLSIRIYLDSNRRALGPGMAELLERIAAHGSMRQAALAMGMSYRKAWLLVQGMQKTFGGPMLDTSTGGVAGGGAKLTKLAKAVLKAYRRIEARAAAGKELRALMALLPEPKKQNPISRKRPNNRKI